MRSLADRSKVEERWSWGAHISSRLGGAGRQLVDYGGGGLCKAEDGGRYGPRREHQEVAGEKKNLAPSPKQHSKHARVIQPFFFLYPPSPHPSSEKPSTAANINNERVRRGS